jgi:hypothetical protein
MSVHMVVLGEMPMVMDVNNAMMTVKMFVDKIYV